MRPKSVIVVLLLNLFVMQSALIATPLLVSSSNGFESSRIQEQISGLGELLTQSRKDLSSDRKAVVKIIRVPGSEEIDSSGTFSDDYAKDRVVLTETPKIPTSSPKASPVVPGPADPAVVKIEWFNSSTGDRTTWGLDSTSVDIHITIKGPFAMNDRVDIDLKKNVVAGSDSVWASAFHVFPAPLGMNETKILVWSGRSLDPAETYGNGLLEVDRYFLEVWQTVPSTQKIYGDSQDESGVLWMWGDFHFYRTDWLNSTSEWLSTAEPGWQVAPYTSFNVVKGPIWSVDLTIKIRYDIVFWFDEDVTSDVLPITGTLLPGSYRIYWTGWFWIPTNREYGNGVGDTRGLFDEVWYGGLQIYQGAHEGYELFVVPNIPNQAPQVSIFHPADGTMIEASNFDAYAVVRDPNSVYDVNQVSLYLNGNVSDITSEYNPTNQSVTFVISIPSSFAGVLNITVEAFDSQGLSSSDTVLVIVKLPSSVFPSGYQVTELNYTGTLASYTFEWHETLTWTLGEDYNVTITPWARFTFDISATLQLLSGLPITVEAGDDFLALFKVTSLVYTLDFRFELGFDTYFQAENNTFPSSLIFYNESLSTMFPVPLGVHTYDLHSDIPYLSEWLEPLTHFTIFSTNTLPYPIDWLVDLELSLDIVPELKVLNYLVCDLIGTNASVSQSELTWLGNEMIAINCTADADLTSSDSIQLDLTNFEMVTQAGITVNLDLTLAGRILHEEIFVNVNEWMQTHLGIIVPTLDVWLPALSLSLPMSATYHIAATEPTAVDVLDVDMADFFASESEIRVTVFVTDTSDAPITGASVTGLIGATPYTASELGSGYYLFTLPYTSTSFDLEVTVAKLGYPTKLTTMSIYVDPLTVDETPPTISAPTLYPLVPSYDAVQTVNVSVSDNLTGVDIVWLKYSTGTTWNTILCTQQGLTDYSGVIPAFPYGTLVQYQIVAVDLSGRISYSPVYSYSVMDTVAPQIGNPILWTTQEQTGPTLWIGAPIADGINASGIAQVTLSYYLNLQWYNASMEGAGVYVVTIPDIVVGTLIQFRITATDGAGNISATEIMDYLIPGSGPAASLPLLIIGWVGVILASFTIGWLLWRQRKYLKSSGEVD